MEKELWEKCAAFHGHECGGLTIGYKAALYAIKLLELDAVSEKAIFCFTSQGSRHFLFITERAGNLCAWY